MWLKIKKKKKNAASGSSTLHPRTRTRRFKGCGETDTAKALLVSRQPNRNLKMYIVPVIFTLWVYIFRYV